MAASTSSFSLPLHLLRCTLSSSTRLAPVVLHRPPLPSARLQLQLAKGLKTVAPASYQEAAAAHGDADVAAAELRVARTGGGGAPSPKGRPGQPRESGGGRTNAMLMATARQGRRTPTRPGLPAEGSGGQGGSVH